MKNLYDVYGTEENLEVDGVWLDYGVARVKIARSGNKNTNYLKTFKKVMNRYGKKGTDSLTDEEHDGILAEVFAKSVIKAWEIKDENKEWKSGIQLMTEGELIEVPVSWETIRQCLLDLPDLFKDLRDSADSLRTFQKETEEDQLKN